MDDIVTGVGTSQSKLGQPRIGIWPARLLAGLQAGVLAGVLMTAWLMLDSLRRGQPVWTTPNLVSTAILGREGLRTTLGGATLAGLSLLVMVAGLHGMVLAALVPPTVRVLWAAQAGIFLSLVSYGFFFGWALKHVAPLVALRASRPAWLAACLLFGAACGFYAQFVRDLIPTREAFPQVLQANPDSGVESDSTQLS